MSMSITLHIELYNINSWAFPHWSQRVMLVIAYLILAQSLFRWDNQADLQAPMTFPLCVVNRWLQAWEQDYPQSLLVLFFFAYWGKHPSRVIQSLFFHYILGQQIGICCIPDCFWNASSRHHFHPSSFVIVSKFVRSFDQFLIYPSYTERTP